LHGLLEGTGYSIILYSSGIPDNLSEMLKGVLEGIVLEIISRGEIYGYEITRRLHAMGFEGLGEATVYALLLRLEKNKLVHVTKRLRRSVLRASFARSTSGGWMSSRSSGRDGIF